MAVLPEFGYNWVPDGTDSNGLRLGDTTLRGQYMLTEFHEGSWMPTTALAVSETFPTGDYDRLGSNPSNGLGSGFYTTKIGLWSQDYFWMPNGRILRTRLNLTYAIPDGKATVDGVSVYGTPPGFRGEVDGGKTFTVDASFEYSLTQNWVPVFEVIYSHTDGGYVTGSASSSSGGLLGVPTRSNSASSEAFDLAPAVEYNWNGHYGLIVGADFTVAGRNTGASVTPQAALNIYY